MRTRSLVAELCPALEGKELMSSRLSMQRGPVELYYRCGVDCAALKSEVDNAYSGKLTMAFAVKLPTSEVLRAKVFSSAETPGLGSRVGEDSFLRQFAGKTVEGLKLKRDGGSIDAISGATISSRAVVSALEQGLRGLSKGGRRLCDEGRVDG